MEYFFPYNKIHKELQRRKSLDYSNFASTTEWEWFCHFYLNPELIGDYNDVEWVHYGITADNLSEKISHINNIAEMLRLLTYMRDNAYRFMLNHDCHSSVSVSELEKAVCIQIDSLLRDIDKPLGVENRFSNFLNLRKIVERGEIPNVACDHTYDIDSMNTSKRIIAKHLPHTNDDSHWDVFHCTTIIKVARICLHDFIETIDHAKNRNKEHVVKEFCDIEKRLNFIVEHLCIEENRLLLGKIQPIIQVLFALCIYLNIDPLTNRWRDYSDCYRNAIEMYLTSKYNVKRAHNKMNLCIEELMQIVNKIPYSHAEKKMKTNKLPHLTDNTESRPVELFKYIHYKITTDEERLNIHQQICHITQLDKMQRICKALTTLMREEKILSSIEQSAMLTELRRLGMPNGKTRGFSDQNFYSYYMTR